MASKSENLVLPSLSLEKLFCMKGGNGVNSYANNSQAQARHAQSVQPLLEETLDLVSLSDVEEKKHGNDSLRVFSIADLGCSSSSNTIHAINVIINHITKRHEALSLELPEFSAFYSDLPSNDFNTLFQLLPSHVCGKESPLVDDRSRSYFVAGVPGSFHRRLFPARSIDFFHSAFSLHWLSQVPESVTDNRSRAYNGGRVFIQGASESTVKAYRDQFQSDLAAFLRMRSVEMKRTGSMFLVCLGRTSPDPTDQGGPGLLFGTHFQDAWDDLVQEGLISSEKRDAFNVPVFAPSVQEFKEVLEADGSFCINKLQLFKGGSPFVLGKPEDDAAVGRALATTCRTIAGVLVDAHIGEWLSEELFSRVEMRATGDAKEVLEKVQLYHIVASLSFRNDHE
ncbi:hypothetical protein MLD38_034250 [Melastoma candidum]|uniref:Uncharacterized protein n=1 Tax=Melastoma candidum TaxID=119954 RepID=A0ACB9MAP8_9MYRT|nr:hypothetical protein MLD38_034250 [Melastoma candidum]